MRIAFNGQRLAGQPFGVGRYLEYLLRHWNKQLAESEELTVFVRRPPPEWLGELGPRIRTELRGNAVGASAQPSFFDAAGGVSLAGSPPLLTDHTGYGYAKGAVNADSTMYLANEASSHWSLSVGGHDVPRSTAFGWANAFHVPESGIATLRFKTPITRYALLVLQMAFWGFVLRRLWAWRRQERTERRAPVDEVVA